MSHAIQQITAQIAAIYKFYVLLTYILMQEPFSFHPNQLFPNNSVSKQSSSDIYFLKKKKFEVKGWTYKSYRGFSQYLNKYRLFSIILQKIHHQKCVYSIGYTIQCTFISIYKVKHVFLTYIYVIYNRKKKCNRIFQFLNITVYDDDEVLEYIHQKHSSYVLYRSVFSNCFDACFINYIWKRF